MHTTVSRTGAALVLMLLTLILLVGCATPPAQSPVKSPAKPSASSPIDYANAYKALMVRYREQSKLLEARPLPPKSLPVPQRRAAMIQQLKEVADLHADYAKQLIRLTPPPEYAEVNAASEAMLRSIADGYYHWIQAIQSGNREEQSRVQKEMGANALEASLRLQTALKKAGGGAEELDSLVNDLKDKK